ncbi:AraC family transcriptional regulator ligand-binding domain-containing protein [Pseudomonas graminis]|uniref:AraC family transcriptional regulator n=1 Tax=Pseudomonas graminis TaxID=158627 RepID=UPI00234A02FF|nr:AraC family transcriptional regulator [Pseudomonas graminis]MDC6382379.1 AraC family transcriptional regulator ligand-binding domain-containing protein [Pseudomonas graminis]
MREKDSVSIYFVQLIVHALRDQPLRLQSVLQAAEIDMALLDDPTTRVSASAFAALWLIQIKELGDEFFGLDSHGMPLGSFALICRGLIQEPNLEKALRQCLSNFGLFLRDFRGSLIIRGPRALLAVDTTTDDPVRQRFGEETFLLLMISLLCWLGGRRISIDRAQFRQRRQRLSDDSLLWGFNLSFGEPRTEIEFSSHYLRLPVVQSLPSLKSFLRTAPQWLVIRYRNQRGLAAQVYQRLRNSHYGHWPTLLEMADELKLSATTFRRRLEREGCAFQGIKDDVRRGIAQQKLRDTELSVVEIASLVGFQEPSAFHRAFKKWTGESPGAYRSRDAGLTLRAVEDHGLS